MAVLKIIMSKSSLLNVLFLVLSYAIFAYFGIPDRTILFIYIALIIHEMGHYLLMKKYRYKDVKFGILPAVGAYVQGKTDVLRQKQHMKVILAGPIPGILIGCLLYAINIVKPSSIILELSEIFILLNVFNLLPIAVLDGGKFFSLLFLKTNMQKLIFSFVSVMISLGLMLYFQNIFALILAVIQYLEFYLSTKTIRYMRSSDIIAETTHNILRSSRLRKAKQADGSLNPQLIRIDKSCYPGAVLIYDNLSVQLKVISVVLVLLMICSSFLVFLS